MLAHNKNPNQVSFLSTFEEILDRKHGLYKLANKIDWNVFEQAFSPLYSSGKGRPAKPIRLMVGLLMLKHIRNVSDEMVVVQWSENAYYQYFCGEVSFATGSPCEASVQEKNITYPTDAKLHNKIIKKCKQIAEQENVKVRQTYTQTLKKLATFERFRNHPKNSAKARKAYRKIKTIAGRLVRELERKLAPNSLHHPTLEIFKRVLSQKRNTTGKIYSLHEQAVCCISKGKEHKKYEFGSKASFVKTDSGVIVGALGFRNEYDGHTLEAALEQVNRLTGKVPKVAKVDRGYRGKKQVGNTEILIPSTPKKSDSYYKRKKLSNAHKKKAAIEPVIGHLKSDHRLNRNFYKGIVGDNINIMLAAAAFNFKRMMNKCKSSFWFFFTEAFYTITNLLFWNLKFKMTF